MFESYCTYSLCCTYVCHLLQLLFKEPRSVVTSIDFTSKIWKPKKITWMLKNFQLQIISYLQQETRLFFPRRSYVFLQERIQSAVQKARILRQFAKAVVLRDLESWALPKGWHKFLLRRSQKGHKKVVFMEHAKKNSGRAMFSILAETMVNYEIVMKVYFRRCWNETI